MDVQQSKLLTARLRLEDLACGALGEDEGMAVCRVGQPRPALQYETQTPDVAVPESKE